MKNSTIPMEEAESTRKALEEIERSFGKVRTGLRAGVAEAAYLHANSRAPFQPQVIALYGVVIAN